MFSAFPSEVNRLIGSFLDIDSRVQFFKVLPSNEDKFVRKLESEKHDQKVKVKLVNSKINKIERAMGDPDKQAILIHRMLSYLAKTKMVGWFINHDNFVKMAYNQACKYSNKDELELTYVRSRRIRKQLIKSALLCKQRFKHVATN